MKKILVLTTLLTIVATCASADSWDDPSWKEMLDSSHVVALIRYMSSGDFRAKAEIINVYKGILKVGDQIWISGFSNRYGPIDKVKPGDQYLVFLRLNRPTEEGIKYWVEESRNDSKLGEYVAYYKNNKTYRVWSPTSGDLTVDGDRIQFDLLQTTYYKKQSYTSRSFFENFLRAYYNRQTAPVFVQTLVKNISAFSEENARVQELMMLQLIGYSDYLTIFEKYATASNPGIRFATAQLMGNIKTDESRKILSGLLNDPHSIVQGEAVRQLENESPEFVGPLLTSHLKFAASGNAGPSNVMDPVNNTIDGGRAQMVKTLGKIGYKPAIPFLLPLLETRNDNEFRLIVETLRLLGSTGYDEYINKHLRNLEDKMVHDLCYIIKDDSLIQCVSSLMYYVENHDRTKWPSQEITISTYFGLAKFRSNAVVDFLIKDFDRLLKTPFPVDAPEGKKAWLKEYLATFAALGIKSEKSKLYDAMFDYYGFDSNFRDRPEMFRSRQQTEDSIKQVILDRLENEPDGLKVVAYINLNKGKTKLKRYTVSATTDHKSIETLVQKMENIGVPKENLIISNGSSTYLFGAKIPDNFGDPLMDHFLDYIAANADDKDIAFMENLKFYNYPDRAYDRQQLQKYLDKAANKN